ncbi:MAG: acyl carrier protein [Clostridiales bacterium]|jgi:acyl carrier protein|nr:acyl carrier protein [Clostridiales bacterium]
MKVTNEQIAKELKDFLVDELLIDLSPADISEQASLGNDIGVDSLGFTELMAHLEDEYKIKITDEEFKPENFRTIEVIMNLVQHKLSQQQ